MASCSCFPQVLIITPHTGTQSLRPTSWVKIRANLLLSFVRDGTLRPREGKELAPGSTARKEQSPTSTLRLQIQGQNLPRAPHFQVHASITPQGCGLDSRPCGLLSLACSISGRAKGVGVQQTGLLIYQQCDLWLAPSAHSVKWR